MELLKFKQQDIPADLVHMIIMDELVFVLSVAQGSPYLLAG